MTKSILNIIFVSALFITLHGFANAQTSEPNLVVKTLIVGKKASFAVVEKSAKASYSATKFVGNKVAKPIIIKSAPKTAKFALKQTGHLIKKSYPIGKKLFVKYIKYKLIP